MNTGLAAAIKARATELGFHLVGIAPINPSAFAEEYCEWLARGHAAEMNYLVRTLRRRLNPHELLPGARAIIVVGMRYHNPAHEETAREPEDLQRGLFARFARGTTCQDVMEPMLNALLEFLQERAGPGTEGRVCIDTTPILEREMAYRAGLGWFGKNTMLINTELGSYFYLGEIVTNASIETDKPREGGCGTCTRCIDACPTGALVAPFDLDSRRCIAYLTLKLQGPIPEPLRPALSSSGARIFGCDICQEVCPFNQPHGREANLPQQPSAAKAPPVDSDHGRLAELLFLDEDAFRCRFKSHRDKRRTLLRNVAVALAGSDHPEAEVALKKACYDPEPIVRHHAEWALEQIRRRRESRVQHPEPMEQLEQPERRVLPERPEDPKRREQPDPPEHWVRPLRPQRSRQTQEVKHPVGEN